MRVLRDYEVKKALTEMVIGDEDLIEVLINELKKPFLFDLPQHYKRKSLFRRTSVNLLSMEQNFNSLRRNQNVKRQHIN